jgi:mono/diheme cytochrome c family protein
VSKFILGVIIAATVLVLGGLGFAMLGLFPTKANTSPAGLEQFLAHRALHASMEHHAPQLINPLAPSDQNLIEGMKVYYVNCALCHGGLDGEPSALSKNLYPPAPNLISDPPDNPEWQIFFTIRTGVRYTGMPAWDGVVAEQDSGRSLRFSPDYIDSHLLSDNTGRTRSTSIFRLVEWETTTKKGRREALGRLDRKWKTFPLRSRSAPIPAAYSVASGTYREQTHRRQIGSAEIFRFARNRRASGPFKISGRLWVRMFPIGE